MATKIGINGFGRIGRAFMRASHGRSDIEVVAINDLGNADQFAYLLKYDSVYGQAAFDVRADGESLMVDGRKIEHFSEPDPAKIPWDSAGVDIVVESTGLFTSFEKSKAHLDAGAKRVVITAPVKDAAPEGIEAGTVLMGINEDRLETCQITSNASCTTNASSPLIQILHEAIGIEKALLSTTHAYTASQALVDGPAKRPKGPEDWRDGRAAAQNIVPSSTGAAIAVTQAVTDLKGKFDGISLRVPVVAGSIADITFLAKRDTTSEEVNDILRKAAGEERWKKVFSVTEEPVVSSDIVGSNFASIADLSMTRVVDGNLVKVLAWYDNEMGYVHSLVEHVAEMAKHL
jgi:glyceraldehyde 3-phosphate dehydrogenase